MTLLADNGLLAATVVTVCVVMQTFIEEDCVILVGDIVEAT